MNDSMFFAVLLNGKVIYEGEQSFNSSYAQDEDDLLQLCLFYAYKCIEDNISMGLCEEDDIDLGNFSILINHEDEYPISRKDYDEYLELTQ